MKDLNIKLIPVNWNNGVRAHKMKCVRYTHNHIKKLFENENCELITEYKNQKTLLTYKYEGKEYQVRFNDWKHHNSRPHKS